MRVKKDLLNEAGFENLDLISQNLRDQAMRIESLLEMQDL